MTIKKMIILFSFLIYTIIYSQDTTSTENVLIINSNPQGAVVCIDDKECGRTPLTLVSYKFGKYKVDATRDGLKKEMFINYTGGQKELFFILDGGYGLLTIKSFPENAQVFIDGTLCGVTPLEDVRIALGKHKIRLVKNDFLDTMRDISVKEMKHDILINMEYKYSSLTVLSSPENASVFIDDSLRGFTPLKNLVVDIGYHKIKLAKENYLDVVKEIYIKGENNDVDIEMDFGYSLFKIENSDEIKSIKIDGEPIPKEKLNDYTISIGEHNTEVELLDAKEIISENFLIKKNTKNLLRINQNVFSIKYPAMSFVFPGLGQLFDRSTIKASAYFVASILNAFFYISTNNQYKKELDNFDQLKDKYVTSTNEYEIQNFYAQMKTKRNTINNLIDKKNLAVELAVTIYLINLIDAFLFHSSEHTISILENPYSIKNKDNNIGLNLRVKF